VARRLNFNPQIKTREVGAAAARERLRGYLIDQPIVYARGSDTDKSPAQLDRLAMLRVNFVERHKPTIWRRIYGKLAARPALRRANVV
jgi:hypothetical protein